MLGINFFNPVLYSFLGKLDDLNLPKVADPEEERKKRQSNRKKIIEELIKTDQAYNKDIKLVTEKVYKVLKEKYVSITMVYVLDAFHGYGQPWT